MDLMLSIICLSLIHTITAQLNANLSLKQLGQLDYFLGLQVIHLSDGCNLMTQTKYIHDLLHKTNRVLIWYEIVNCLNRVPIFSLIQLYIGMLFELSKMLLLLDLKLPLL